MRKSYCLLTLIGSIAVLGIEVFAQAGSANQTTLSSSAGGTQPPAITSFTPMSGPIGTVVTIEGTNFGATPLHDMTASLGTWYYRYRFGWHDTLH